MKKFLLFGTMLGVASAALAFGGIFNHGNKSTTYKGGVNAIGVHFGGEKKTADSQAKETGETCPAEKQCGDYCCQGDNVCKQDPDSGEYQCCDQDLTQCCPNNQGVYSDYRGFWGKYCCDGEIFCVQGDTSGNCLQHYYCCPQGKKVVCALYENDICTNYTCCQEGEAAYFNISDGANCCEPEKIYCTEQNDTGDCTHFSCCNGSIVDGNCIED